MVNALGRLVPGRVAYGFLSIVVDALARKEDAA